MIQKNKIPSAEFQQYAETISLDAFETSLEDYLSKLGTAIVSTDLQSIILKDFTALMEVFEQLADEAYHKNSASDIIIDPIYTYQINYQLPEEFKNLSILHRDVLLELQKVDVISGEKKIPVNRIASHFTESKNTLLSALEYFKSKLETFKIQKIDYTITAKKTTKTLELSTNPWLLYKSQFDTLKKQFLEIDSSKRQMLKTIENFKNIRSVVNVAGDSNAKLNATLEEVSVFLNSKLAEQDETQSLLHYVDEVLLLLETLGIDLPKITEDLQVEITELPDLYIPISTSDGVLQQREVDFSREVQKWFDYQILPEIMDLVSQENNIKAKARVTFINLKNSIHLTKNSERKTNNDFLSNTLSHFSAEINTNKISNQKLTEEIEAKIANELIISRLYEESTFLSVPINTTLTSSVNLGKHTLIKKLKGRSERIYAFFNKRYEQSNYLDTFSDIEITTKCIAHRMLKQKNEHYDILFLNKNFIGDLFLVPRALQEEKLKEAISQWNNGFSKATLIYGDRLSGRSAFLEATSRKYFGKDIVTLKPNSLATIDGRKFTTTFDLKEALDYLKNNNSKSTRPVVLIDDLELWRNENHSLLNNIRALINFVETESDDAFIMVSTNSVMKNHLDCRLGFSNVFSTRIDLSKMGSNEIFQALLLRHGAAHRTLVTNDGTNVSDRTIEKTALRLCKKYNYNVGDVLQAWTYNTYVQENEDVLFKPEEFEFLDFFTQQELIILKQTLLFRTITEVGLKRVTGLSFESEFRSANRRLINSKILLRDLKGNLYINPVVHQDVTQLLINKMFLYKN